MLKSMLIQSLIFGALLLNGCAKEGEAADLNCGRFGHEHDDYCHCEEGYTFDGTTCVPSKDGGNIILDCGDFGHEHSGHCHCDPGYLFDGQTCVLPDDIAQTCAAEVTEHIACRCPISDNCPCEHGKIEDHGPDSYCVPEQD